MRFRLLTGKHQTGKKLDGTLKNYSARVPAGGRPPRKDAGKLSVGTQYYYTETSKNRNGHPVFSCDHREEELPDIVETDVDLAARFNSTDPSLRKKFDRLGAIPSAIDTGDSLEALKNSELKSLAEAEEIDLGGATTKEDMIAVIRNSGVVIG